MAIGIITGLRYLADVGSMGVQDIERQRTQDSDVSRRVPWRAGLNPETIEASSQADGRSDHNYFCSKWTTAVELPAKAVQSATAMEPGEVSPIRFRSERVGGHGDTAAPSTRNSSCASGMRPVDGPNATNTTSSATVLGPQPVRSVVRSWFRRHQQGAGANA